MAKTSKQIEYFSHDVKRGKTIFMLEKRYGNNGYALWFKLLEFLGGKDNHFINLNNESEFLTFCDYVNLEKDKTLEILELLATTETIDAELFNSKIIWCQNFVDRLSGLYKKRHEEIPVRPMPTLCLPIAHPMPTHSPGIAHPLLDKAKEIKAKEIKENKSKENESKKNEIVSTSIYDEFMKTWNVETSDSFSKIVKLSNSRLDKIRTRLKEDKDFLVHFKIACQKASQNSFLSGNNERNWRLSFDFLIENDTNYLKILEDRYTGKLTNKEKEEKKFKEIINELANC